MTTFTQLTPEIRSFLNQLRREGVINMYSAAPYIESMFGLYRNEARKALSEWMESFTENDR